ncbi:Hypothetical protein FKW44_014798, partial [Caligus rogercresseyi]
QNRLRTFNVSYISVESHDLTSATTKSSASTKSSQANLEGIFTEALSKGLPNPIIC